MSCEDIYAVICRERETEKKIRAMDAADIVELVHGLEDEIERHEMASDMLRDDYAELESKLAAAEEELSRYRNGYKGSCYACETVGERNVELEDNVRVLRDALDAIAESEWDASAGLLRDIANNALATTAPEGGEV